MLNPPLKGRSVEAGDLNTRKALLDAMYLTFRILAVRRCQCFGS